MIQEEVLAEKGYAKLTESQLLSFHLFFKSNKIPQQKISALSGYRSSPVSTILAFKKPVLEKTLIRILKAVRTYCRQTDMLLLTKFDALIRRNKCESYIKNR